MKRPTLVAISVAVVAVMMAALVTAVLALALGNRDRDWGPGMMTSTAQDRDDCDPGRSGPGSMMGGGSMGAGMHVAVRSEAEFLVEMAAHHEEAIDAAGELARSERPEMRELGRSIVEGQTAEVEQMRGWLEEWYPDTSTNADYEPMMRDLEGLTGDELDRVFLEDMIGHHMAAVMMSQQLVVRDLADHGDVEDLARSISSSQHAEILTMRAWLWEWFG
jgi:uncharacterized protein (DUF305 family)